VLPSESGSTDLTRAGAYQTKMTYWEQKYDITRPINTLTRSKKIRLIFYILSIIISSGTKHPNLLHACGHTRHQICITSSSSTSSLCYESELLDKLSRRPGILHHAYGHSSNRRTTSGDDPWSLFNMYAESSSLRV
jgi:hypothetical protein